ncbi:MAG: hypothetical protein ACREVW_09685, partial [Burkholderiales bacterium]
FRERFCLHHRCPPPAAHESRQEDDSSAYLSGSYGNLFTRLPWTRNLPALDAIAVRDLAADPAAHEERALDMERLLAWQAEIEHEHRINPDPVITVK